MYNTHYVSIYMKKARLSKKALTGIRNNFYADQWKRGLAVDSLLCV